MTRCQARKITPQLLELLVTGDEIGLAVELDEGCARLCNGSGNDAFGSRTACSLLSARLPFRTEDIPGALNIALGFCKGFLTFHHARARLLAQLAYHLGGYLHLLLPISMISRQ